MEITFAMFVSYQRMIAEDLPGLTDKELDKLYEQENRKAWETLAVQEGLES